MKKELKEFFGQVAMWVWVNFSSAWLCMWLLGSMTTFHPSFSQTLGIFTVLMVVFDAVHIIWNMREQL